MPTIVVAGATGVTGRRLVAAFAEQGHEVVAMPAEATADARRSVAADTDVVVTVARSASARSAWLAAAVAAGTSVIDGGSDPAVVVDAVDDLAARAAAGRVTVVPGAGAALGDLLAAMAIDAVGDAEEVHVCWAFPDRGGWRQALPPGLRAEAAERLAAPMPVLDGGRRSSERVGEARRLAWFPRPIGPVHAAAVPGPDPVTVPLHAPTVGVARTYLALPSWRAELLQATGAVLRSPRWRGPVARRLEQGDEPPVGEQAPRWACVAESRGRDGVARAWANGRDAVGLGVAGVVALTEVVAAGRAPVGVVSASQAAAPAALLDDLSVAAGLRWSVVRPSAATFEGGRHGG